MGILTGMRVVEGSAFVAIPLAGMTLAQMGADVIRFDRIEGGLDAGRWPVTAEGRSLFWAGLNKGKRSVALDLQSPEGREIATADRHGAGAGRGPVPHQPPRRGWLDYPTLSARRADLDHGVASGRPPRPPAVDYTVNPAVGFPDATGPEGADHARGACPARMGLHRGQLGGHGAACRRTPPASHRRRAAGRVLAQGCGGRRCSAISASSAR